MRVIKKASGFNEDSDALATSKYHEQTLRCTAVGSPLPLRALWHSAKAIPARQPWRGIRRSRGRLRGNKHRNLELDTPRQRYCGGKSRCVKAGPGIAALERKEGLRWKVPSRQARTAQPADVDFCSWGSEGGFRSRPSRPLISGVLGARLFSGGTMDASFFSCFWNALDR